MTKQNFMLGSLFLGVALTGCGDGGGPTAGGKQVSFSLATRSSASAPAPALAALGSPQIIGSGSDTLVIDTVQLVLRRIDLKRVEAGGACDSMSNGGEADDHDDACEKVQAGPLFLDLPLGAGAAHQFTISIDTGTYDRLRIQLHRTTDDPGDAALLAAHPEIAGASIRVVGSFNGTAFVFLSDLTADQEVDLNPPLVVGQSAPVDLTLFVDTDLWFKNQSGGLVDPATAAQGGVNENQVRDNIRNSFRAFEDDNHNGEDDHDGHDQGGDDGSHHGSGG